MPIGRIPVLPLIAAVIAGCATSGDPANGTHSYWKFAFRVDEYMKKDNFFSPLVSGDGTVPASRLTQGRGSKRD